MILFDNKEKIIKFIICINILLLFILVIKTLFYKDEDIKEYNSISTSVIKNEGELTNIYVEYPRFNDNDEINKIITDLVYNYIKEFKMSEEPKSLDISYGIFNIGDFVNITFNINNTLSNIKYRNLLIDLKHNTISYITALYDKNYLEDEINKIVYNKYQTEIYNKIINENINNYTYIIFDDKIEVYFNCIDWSEYDYIPYITIDLNENTIHTNTNNINKYIAFTYDDGPSEYTLDLLNILEKNNSSATFFVIGNKIKGRENIINKIYNSKSEVGIHGYSHSNLTKLSSNEINTEINSTSILYNNITNDKTFLLRPPYGDYNENIIKLNYNIILWNIDSKDWLVKDSTKIYNNVIKNACDGCVVLMHDTYNETIDATEKLIPELKKQGYSIVSISELLKIKKYKLTNNIISYIK